MANAKHNHSILAHEIDKLRSAMCPHRYRYTHEFLELATMAARHEAVGDDNASVSRLVKSLVTH
jgi:hypothetical protein